MPYATILIILVIVHIFCVIISANDGNGFTYKYFGYDSGVLELDCQIEAIYPGKEILQIAIYNGTSMAKMAQVYSGKCPTIEDTSSGSHLFLRSCSPSVDHETTSLKVLVTNYNSNKVQLFLCNFTKMDDTSRPVTVIWAVTVEKQETTSYEGKEYAGPILFPESANKIMASIQHDVKLLEPSIVAAGILFLAILVTLAIQLFLSCKIIGQLDKRRLPKHIPLSRSQSKMTDRTDRSNRSKSIPLEDDPFYASV